jgi:hypothetical protein
MTAPVTAPVTILENSLPSDQSFTSFTMTSIESELEKQPPSKSQIFQQVTLLNSLLCAAPSSEIDRFKERIKKLTATLDQNRFLVAPSMLNDLIQRPEISKRVTGPS